MGKRCFTIGFVVGLLGHRQGLGSYLPAANPVLDYLSQPEMEQKCLAKDPCDPTTLASLLLLSINRFCRCYSLEHAETAFARGVLDSYKWTVAADVFLRDVPLEERTRLDRFVTQIGHYLMTEDLARMSNELSVLQEQLRGLGTYVREASAKVDTVEREVDRLVADSPVPQTAHPGVTQSRLRLQRLQQTVQWAQKICKAARRGLCTHAERAEGSLRDTGSSRSLEMVVGTPTSWAAAGSTGAVRASRLVRAPSPRNPRDGKVTLSLLAMVDDGGAGAASADTAGADAAGEDAAGQATPEVAHSHAVAASPMPEGAHPHVVLTPPVSPVAAHQQQTVVTSTPPPSRSSWWQCFCPRRRRRQRDAVEEYQEMHGAPSPR